MRPSLPWLALALGLLAVPASANPIRVTFDLTDQSGFGGRSDDPRTFSVILPDQPEWSWYQLNSRHVSAPRYPEIEPVSAEFRLTLSFDRLFDGPVSPGAPSIVYDVKLDGFINSQYDGDSSAEGAWRPTDLTMTSEWSPSSNIPLPLISFFKDEADFYGFVAGGVENSLYAAFTLPPIPSEYLATPVPEPTTVLAWTLVGLGALTYRRRNRRTGRSIWHRSAPAPARPS